MKKVISLLLMVVLLSMLAVPVLAASNEPVITLQPQTPNYPEYSVARYIVKATGTNLSATWYMEWEGKTYEISKTGGSVQPWEAYAGETYGAEKLDDNTFTYFFGGIEHNLNGATIWCVIEDGHHDVTSQKAYINLGNPADPPEILEIAAKLSAEQGEKVQIKCVARSTDDTQLGYIWYETTTGKMEDIQAIERGTEIGDTLTCDSGKVGTRYYVCAVNTSAGAICYSNVIPVVITEKKQAEPTTAATEPTVSTQTTEPTIGTQTTEPTADTQTTEPTSESQNATIPTTEPSTQTEQPEKTIPWWVLVLVGLGAAGLGVGVAVILIKKK